MITVIAVSAITFLGLAANTGPVQAKVPGPNGQIVFSPSATCSTTMFSGTQWVTTVPVSGSDEILLSALGSKPLPTSSPRRSL